MKYKRYIWFPLVLLAYFLFMTFKYGVDLLRSGHEATFWVTCLSEVVVLILLSLSLRRRDRLRRERDEDIRRNNPR